MHAAIGISGEVAELIMADYNNDEKNYREEMGDARFYMEALFQAYGWTYAELLAEDGRPEFTMTALSHALIAAGDILDLAKKSWVYGKEMDVVKLRSHCVALVASYHLMLDTWSLIDNDITSGNMYKLTLAPNARYKLGYSDQAAIARADKVGEETEKPNNDGVTRAPGAFDNLFDAANTALAKAG